VHKRFGYRAFISYSHRDTAWANWLLRSLESYRIPKHLVGKAGHDGPIPERLYPVFRDREELAASADLTVRIRQALAASACQIVICSPSAAKSRWVHEEILAFKKLGREDRILALIVDGEPAAGGERECFPEALQFRLGADGQLSSEAVEPIAADARPQGDGKENAKLKLIAGLLGIGYAELRQRELEAGRRRTRLYQSIAAAMALLALLTAGAGLLALQKQHEAEYQRDQALQAQARSLTQTAAISLKDGDPATAFSADGKRLVTASDDRTARIWDAQMANGL
jgi:hypothetical protein